MATTSQPAGSFDDADSRYNKVNIQPQAWAEELIHPGDEAAGSQAFQYWLDFQSCV